VGETLFGIQASQDIKLSSVARSLREDIPLIKTEDRLSRNLHAEELETHLRTALLRLGSQRVQTHTVLGLDLSDVRKQYARKMEFLDQVCEGSAGEGHAGYWLCSVIGELHHAGSRERTKIKNPTCRAARVFRVPADSAGRQVGFAQKIFFL
jgi:hypothetical protein